MIWDVVMAYDKSERPIWAGKKNACKEYYWEKLVAILEKFWEYKTKEHDNKNQLEIPFNF